MKVITVFQMLAITGGGGTGASAEAVVSSGTVTGFRIINTGIGYTEAPTVNVTGVSTTGIGTFTINETVTGRTSGATARIRDINIDYLTGDGGEDRTRPNKYLELEVLQEHFMLEKLLSGLHLRRHIVKSYDDDSSGDEYDINDNIETEADSIIDFTDIIHLENIDVRNLFLSRNN